MVPGNRIGAPCRARRARGLVGPDDLQLRLLRAQALLELGDPRSVVLVDEVSNEAELTGRPAALWLAASRRAASALLAGRLDEARSTDRSRRRRSPYGSATTTRGGSPTSNAGSWPASPAGGPTSCATVPTASRRSSDWPPWRSLILADAGRADEAAKALEGFRAAEAHGPGVNAGYDLWFPAIAAEAAARSGSDRLRAELYELLAPYAGTQVGCGAWVAYCGPVDGYLADLAFARGDAATGAAHLRRRRHSACGWAPPLWLARLRETADRHAAARADANTFASGTDQCGL